MLKFSRDRVVQGPAAAPLPLSHLKGGFQQSSTPGEEWIQRTMQPRMNFSQFHDLYESSIHPILQLVDSFQRSTPAPPSVHTDIAFSFEKTATLVYQVLDRVANHSWEWGAQAEVIFERRYPEYSVFSNTRKLPLSPVDGPLQPPLDVIKFLESILAKRARGTLPIVDGDGASGDPASLGVSVLVAAATGTGNKKKSAYFQKLADNQLDWLLHHVPTHRGAISHRNKLMQYWSDFLYMAPPFLAYYGAATSNATLLEIAYNQAKQYRTILQDGKIKVWEHIVQGNGWAAAGMMRMYATFQNLRDPKLRKLTEPWREDMAKWVIEIVKGSYAYQYKDSHLLPNYLANTNVSHKYAECSGTAIIAAAAYRLVSLRPGSEKSLPMEAINAARVAIFTKYANKKQVQSPQLWTLSIGIQPSLSMEPNLKLGSSVLKGKPSRSYYLKLGKPTSEPSTAKPIHLGIFTVLPTIQPRKRDRSWTRYHSTQFESTKCPLRNSLLNPRNPP
ncbi:hypothetical protein H4Q26_009392 [Puccinia striiformis f. sp. tritici PST-130]|nr:hypothetical protein H4Q26_009392 [Puccinia striiformis f. sp. tritici PST-130]